MNDEECARNYRPQGLSPFFEASHPGPPPDPGQDNRVGEALRFLDILNVKQIQIASQRTVNVK